jgi:hypothetical protein
MFRVARPGGVVLAYAPMLTTQFSYPRDPANERLVHVLAKVFANGQIAEQLFHIFQKCGGRDASYTCNGVQEIVRYNSIAGANLYARFARMTIEAIRQKIVANNIITQAEYDDLLAGWQRLEHDETAIIFKSPDVWAMAHLK